MRCGPERTCWCCACATPRGTSAREMWCLRCAKRHSAGKRIIRGSQRPGIAHACAAGARIVLATVGPILCLRFLDEPADQREKEAEERGQRGDAEQSFDHVSPAL